MQRTASASATATGAERRFPIGRGAKGRVVKLLRRMSERDGAWIESGKESLNNESRVQILYNVNYMFTNTRIILMNIYALNPSGLKQVRY